MHPLANPFQQTLQRHSLSWQQKIFQEATNFTKFSTAIQLKQATASWTIYQKSSRNMITSKPRHQRPKRYCRKKAEYPLEGNCQVNNVVYKCDVTRPLPKKCILDLQRENGRAVSITIIYHLNTRDIPIR